MPSLEKLKQSILTECEEDHVGLWSVIRDVEDFFPTKNEKAIREQVLAILRELLVANEIRAGFPSDDGRFRSVRTAPEKTLTRIETEWPVGRRPSIGEGLWFTKSKRTGRNLKSYVAKYGDVEGRKMYERLQKEAALASAPARHKTCLRKQANAK